MPVLIAQGSDDPRAADADRPVRECAVRPGRSSTTAWSAVSTTARSSSPTVRSPTRWSSGPRTGSPASPVCGSASPRPCIDCPVQATKVTLEFVGPTPLRHMRKFAYFGSWVTHTGTPTARLAFALSRAGFSAESAYLADGARCRADRRLLRRRADHWHRRRVLALIADAGHMLTDVVALCMGLVALLLARHGKDHRHPQLGWHRAEVFTAAIKRALLSGGWLRPLRGHRTARHRPRGTRATLIIVAATGLAVKCRGDVPTGGPKSRSRCAVPI